MTNLNLKLSTSKLDRILYHCNSHPEVAGFLADAVETGRSEINTETVNEFRAIALKDQQHHKDAIAFYQKLQSIVSNHPGSTPIRDPVSLRSVCVFSGDQIKGHYEVVDQSQHLVRSVFLHILD